MDKEIWSMIDYAISKFSKHIGMCWLFPKEDKYVEKIKSGVVLYTKQKNEYEKLYNKSFSNKKSDTKMIATRGRI